MRTTMNDPFDGKTPFDDENQMREVRQAILISHDHDCPEAIRAMFASTAQKLLARLSNESLRAEVDRCEATESEAIDRGDAGCDAEPGFTLKCVDSATVGRRLL